MLTIYAKLNIFTADTFNNGCLFLVEITIEKQESAEAQMWLSCVDKIIDLE